MILFSLTRVVRLWKNVVSIQLSICISVRLVPLLTIVYAFNLYSLFMNFDHWAECILCWFVVVVVVIAKVTFASDVYPQILWIDSFDRAFAKACAWICRWASEYWEHFQQWHWPKSIVNSRRCAIQIPFQCLQLKYIICQTYWFTSDMPFCAMHFKSFEHI